MKKYASLLLLLLTVVLLSSCEEDIEKRQVTFTAMMPNDDLSSFRPGCIINGVPATDAFNLTAQWKDGDKIKIYILQDEKVYEVESVPSINDISSDGKTCSFQFTLPKKVNRDKDYDVIGVTGVEVYIYESKVIGLCNMKRVSTERSNEIVLPMWFTAKKGSNQAKFRHLCSFEVLYINNLSDSSITFKHTGFQTQFPWYRYNASILLSDGKVGGKEEQSEAESDEITIPSGGTGTIVSWYVPQTIIADVSIDNAKLKAVVNGTDVTTIDAMKSYKNFTRGTAYYMQVSWDGTTLYFSNEFCPDSNHPHIIDLGLPSGTKWACCNLGANIPTKCGYYFAWGETTPKPYFREYNYKWYKDGDDHNITKYCSNSDYGIVDNIVGLQLEDDAAYVNWGPEWRMPGTAQMNEIMNNCTSQWIKINGVGGYLFKSNINNNAVFFPANGWYSKNGLQELENDGTYWSRFNAYSTRPDLAHTMCFRYSSMGWLDVATFSRHNGCGVRAVYVDKSRRICIKHL